VSEQSATRRELEASIRSMLPDHGKFPGLDATKKPTVAAAGVAGAFAGYLWGRVRGRILRKRRSR
jgi:hypothetical protein